jgi:formate hydrogenlyase subunit 6/NADH:ubiquinone oxidoreductase subunit I
MLIYFRDIWLGIITVLRSMGIAWKHLFTRSVTLQYPTERWTMPERSRARLSNKIEDCIGCAQCSRVCPSSCIEIRMEKRGKDEPPVFASDGTPIKLRTYLYNIDMSLCCYCGLCTFSCPTHCLVMTGDYEYSVYDKSEHLYRFAKEEPLTTPKLRETSSGRA